MATSYDPLSLLRDYVTNSKKIDCVGGNLYFGNVKINLQHPTAWKPKTSGKQYSIGSLWFFLQNREADIRTYVKDCTKLGLEIVSRPDYNEIVSYFTGEIETSDAIDEELRMSTLIERTKPEETKTAKKAIIREVLERPLATKESVLQAPGCSFKYLLNYCKDAFKEGKKRQRETASLSLIEEIAQTAHHTSDAQPHPIILVPGISLAGNISIHNARSFLEHGEYVDVTQNRELAPPQPLLITKKLRKRQITFEVYDQTLSFTKRHWRCVVAVFVQGPSYQFKDWPLAKDLVSLFSNVRGFYMKYNDVPVEENVKRWNVKILEVHRHKRHLDKTVQKEFWAEVEKFLFSVRNNRT